MAKYESKQLRNLAVIGHGGTGKTSLCESIPYEQEKRAAGPCGRRLFHHGREDEIGLYVRDKLFQSSTGNRGAYWQRLARSKGCLSGIG